MANIVSIVLCLACFIFFAVAVYKLIGSIKDYRARKKGKDKNPDDGEKGEKE